MTRIDVFRLFRQSVQRMYQNPDLVLHRLALTDLEPENGEPASLVYAGLVRTKGNRLLRCADRYVLRVTNRLLDEPREKILQTVIHEAGHVGHATHSAGFRQLVLAHGGLVSYGGGPPRVEQKVGGRYQTRKTFADETAAERWAKRQARLHPDQRYRRVF